MVLLNCQAKQPFALRDYLNFVKSNPGFNKPVIDELVRLSKLYSNTQRYIMLIFDEV